MSNWNMPPGVSTNDIPGNEPNRPKYGPRRKQGEPMSYVERKKRQAKRKSKTP